MYGAWQRLALLIGFRACNGYEKPGFCDLLLRFDVSTPSEVDFETLSEQCFVGGAPGKLAARLTSCELVFEKLGLIFCIPSPTSHQVRQTVHIEGWHWAGVLAS